MANIVVLGGASWDRIYQLDSFLFPHEMSVYPQRIIEAAGSTGIGKAIPLSKLGHNVTLYIAIGDDEAGHRIRQTLATTNIHVIEEHDPQGTMQHTNLMNVEGERVSILTNAGSTDLACTKVEELRQSLQEADVIVLNIMGYVKPLIPMIQQLNKPVYVDLHDYQEGSSYHQPFLDCATHVQLALSLFPNPNKWIQDQLQSKQMVVVTDGPRKLSVYTPTSDVHLNPDPVDVVDANGAGDHVSAGIIHGMVTNVPLETQLYWGMICAKACLESSSISSEIISPEWIVEKRPIK